MELYDAALKFVKRGDFRDAFYCVANSYSEDKKGGKRLVLGFRQMISKRLKEGEDNPELYEVLHETYVLTAQDSFDDFMIALEWYRPEEEKFWIPRRKQLMPICNALQQLADDELDELFISQPPRTGKTTIVMFFLLWTMCRNPEGSNLYSSYTEAVVKTFFNGVMEVINDPTTYDLRTVFPQFVLASTDMKDLLLNIGRKKRYASLTARSLYGTLNGACDCNSLVIMDDLHSGIEEALNKDLLLKAWMRVENNLLPRAKEKSKRLWIGTRWSLADCIAKRIELLDSDDRFSSIRYKVVNVPALDDNDESNFDYMFNLGFTTETYRQRRASFEHNGDMASWNAQYMGTPVERDGSLIVPEELRYYNGDLPNDIEPDRVWMCVDPAWGGGDYTAAPVIYQYGDDLFIADVVYDNGDKSVTQPLLAYKAMQHKVQAMYVEATKTTAAYAEGVDKILKENNYRLNMQTSTRHWAGASGKEQRIFDKCPEIRDHMVFLDAGKRDKSYNMFMQNVFAFSITSKNAHDDAIDSLAQAISVAFFGIQKARIIRRSI